VCWALLDAALVEALPHFRFGPHLVEEIQTTARRALHGLSQPEPREASLRALLEFEARELATTPDEARRFLEYLRQPHPALALGHHLFDFTVFTGDGSQCAQCPCGYKSVWWEPETDRVLLSCNVCGLLEGDPAERRLHGCSHLLPGKRAHVLTRFPDALFMEVAGVERVPLDSPRH
jgi:hypothetical protein